MKSWPWLQIRRGLVWGLGFSIAIGAGISVSWRILRTESRAYAQQTLGDSAVLLSAHVKSEVVHWGERATELVASQLLAASPSPSTALETHSDLADITFWNAEPGAAEIQARNVWHNVHYRRQRPGLAELIRQLEPQEKKLVQAALRSGHALAVAERGVDSEGMITLAVPVVKTGLQGVIVIHLAAEAFQRAFRSEAMAHSALVDDSGWVLAHSDSKNAFQSWAEHPLYQKFRASTLRNGAIEFQDPQSGQSLGAYARVGTGSLGILASLPEDEALSGLRALKRTAGLAVPLVFAICIGTSILLSRRRSVEPRSEAASAASPERLVVSWCSGELVEFADLLDSKSPEEISADLSELRELARSRADAAPGASFRADTDGSFLVCFRDKNSATHALAFALGIRTDFASWNESRKTDGDKPLTLALGVHTGAAVVAGDGEISGPGLAVARAIRRIAPLHGRDVAVSHDTWSAVEGGFTGEKLGEFEPVPKLGLAPVHALNGYRDGQGAEVAVETPYSRREAAAPAQKWFVNNGSQIVGPLAPREIAQMLYAQEMDFDSECWKDGEGKTGPLGESGIFGTSTGDGANLWIYDQATVHGPLSKGFLATAAERGAIARDAWVCEGSTVNGWKPLSEWLSADKPERPPESSAA